MSNLSTFISIMLNRADDQFSLMNFLGIISQNICHKYHFMIYIYIYIKCFRKLLIPGAIELKTELISTMRHSTLLFETSMSMFLVMNRFLLLWMNCIDRFITIESLWGNNSVCIFVRRNRNNLNSFYHVWIGRSFVKVSNFFILKDDDMF